MKRTYLVITDFFDIQRVRALGGRRDRKTGRWYVEAETHDELFPFRQWIKGRTFYFDPNGTLVEVLPYRPPRASTWERQVLRGPDYAGSVMRLMRKAEREQGRTRYVSPPKQNGLQALQAIFN